MPFAGLSTAADQPLPRAVTAAATALSVTLPAKVTEVSVVVTPLATLVSVSPVSVTATVARWLAAEVFVTRSTAVGA